MKRTGHLRLARDRDIPEIEAWLPREPGSDTLAMNWNISLAQHQVSKLFVWEESESGLPIAYLWGNLNRSDSVLEVDPRQRRHGVGREIVTALIEKARADREPLLEVECAPPSSEPFWQAMGFSTWDDGRTIMGRQILHVPKLVLAGPPASVTVEFHRESYLYDDPRPTPISKHQIAARIGSDELIYFDRLVAEFDLDNGEDLVVRIEVNGVEIFCEKAKREAAGDVGVMRCQGGFKLDWTSIPEAS